MTRSDVLRGASWALSSADTSRSSRGGSVQSGVVFQHRRLDSRTEKCVFAAPGLSSNPRQPVVELAPPVGAHSGSAVQHWLCCSLILKAE